MEGMDSDRPDGGGSGALEKLSSKLSGFISEARGIKCEQLLLSIAQLCYFDTQLSYDMWVELFPKLWSTISDRQRSVSLASATVVLKSFIVYSFSTCKAYCSSSVFFLYLSIQ